MAHNAKKERSNFPATYEKLAQDESCDHDLSAMSVLSLTPPPEPSLSPGNISLDDQPEVLPERIVESHEDLSEYESLRETIASVEATSTSSSDITTKDINENSSPPCELITDSAVMAEQCGNAPTKRNYAGVIDNQLSLVSAKTTRRKFCSSLGTNWFSSREVNRITRNEGVSESMEICDENQNRIEDGERNKPRFEQKANTESSRNLSEINKREQNTDVQDKCATSPQISRSDSWSNMNRSRKRPRVCRRLDFSGMPSNKTVTQSRYQTRGTPLGGLSVCPDTGKVEYIDSSSNMNALEDDGLEELKISDSDGESPPKLKQPKIFVRNDLGTLAEIPGKTSSTYFQAKCVDIESLESHHVLASSNDFTFWQNLRLDSSELVYALRSGASLNALVMQNATYIESLTISSLLLTTDTQVKHLVGLASLYCCNIKELVVDFPDLPESCIGRVTHNNPIEIVKIQRMFVKSLKSLIECLKPLTTLKEIEIHLGDEIEVDLDWENIWLLLVDLAHFFQRNQSLTTVKFCFTVNTEIVRSILTNCHNLTHLELHVTELGQTFKPDAFKVCHYNLKTLVVKSDVDFLTDVWTDVWMKTIKSSFPHLQTLELTRHSMQDLIYAVPKN